MKSQMSSRSVTVLATLNGFNTKVTLQKLEETVQFKVRPTLSLLQKKELVTRQYKFYSLSERAKSLLDQGKSFEEIYEFPTTPIHPKRVALTSPNKEHMQSLFSLLTEMQDMEIKLSTLEEENRLLKTKLEKISKLI